MSDLLIENVPMVLDAGFQSSSYRWTLNKVPLPGATNRVLVLESPQEADAGIYAVIGDDDVVQFKLGFRRAVRVLVNGADVLGDLVKIDTGAFKNGFHGDSCITVGVGTISEKAAKLMRVAEEALYKGIEQVKPGNCMLDLAGAIEDHVKTNGFVVVEDFTGHGVGRNLHEEPSVFNFRTHQLPNVRFRPGMTLAIEPILNAGTKRVRILADKWTAVTVDNQLSAQFEHTVLVTETGYEIFTDRNKI